MIRKIYRYILCFLLSAVMMGAGAAERPKIKIACIGNSITYGYTLKDRVNEAYPSVLQRMLGSSYRVGNFGKSGATLLNRGHRPYMQQEEYRKAISFGADIAVIHLGINDTDPRDWPDYRDDFAGDYLQLIDSLRKRNPKVRIIIAKMTPIRDTHPRFLSGTRVWHKEIQREIERVAEVSGAELIDFYTPLELHPEWLEDAVHPNVRGAALMAEVVCRQITGDYGGLRMSPMFTDNMVLQRNKTIELKGTADAGEKVSVKIAGQRWQTVCGKDGKWSIKLLPMQAGGPYTLYIGTDKRELSYKNVMVGEVWLCSGQSNMEFMLKQAATAKRDIPRADDGSLRLFDMKALWRTNAERWSRSALDSVNSLHYFAPTVWKECRPETAADFSAIAYYFGKMLRDSLNVPVGLICNAVGGSPAESWINREILEESNPFILKDWTRNDFIQKWVRERALQNMGGDAANRHPYEPSYLYSSAVLPMEQYPIEGIIWYQGESNAHNVEAYEELFPLLVSSFRDYWQNPGLPFFFVQLSSLNRPSWPSFRNAQRKLMERIPGTGMVVSSDKGDSLDVHPVDKIEIGRRLARWALNRCYHYRDIVPSGPLFRKATFRGASVTLEFDYSDGLRSADGLPLRTFELAGEDRQFHPAAAQIMGSTVKLTSGEVETSRFVRYAWQPFTRANLVNGAGLPASTFMTELPDCRTLEVEIQKFPSILKGEFGVEKGLSATLSGIVDGTLVVAGGANFPFKPAAVGGRKKFYQDIYAADLSAAKIGWRKVGRLPAPLAYGVALSADSGLIIVGGSNEDGSQRAAFRLRFSDGRRRKMVVEPLPSLPFALDNAGGAVIGSRVYIVGGYDGGKASNHLLELDLENLSKGWKELSSFPGNGRVQPAVAAQESAGETKLYIWGGFAPSFKGSSPTLEVGGYCYSPSADEWMAAAAPVDGEGQTVSLGGGAAAAYGSRYIIAAGGVNKDIFLSALTSPAEDYMTHPAEWYRFNDRLLVYDTQTGVWHEAMRSPSLARAGAALTGNNSVFYYIGGELKPGIRTAENLKIEVR